MEVHIQRNCIKKINFSVPLISDKNYSFYSAHQLLSRKTTYDVYTEKKVILTQENHFLQNLLLVSSYSAILVQKIYS